jgi:hypothetical protein
VEVPPRKVAPIDELGELEENLLGEDKPGEPEEDLPAVEVPPRAVGSMDKPEVSEKDRPAVEATRGPEERAQGLPQAQTAAARRPAANCFGSTGGAWPGEVGQDGDGLCSL